MTAAPDCRGLRVAVIGAGSWGTALAALASQHCPTLLWARNADTAAAMAATRQNVRYLPDVSLPSELNFTASLDDVRTHLAQGDQGLVILGVPVAGLAAACVQVAECLVAPGVDLVGIVWTCKGVDANTGLLPHQVVARALAPYPPMATGVLSGPSFAPEVALGLPG